MPRGDGDVVVRFGGEGASLHGVRAWNTSNVI